LSRGDLPQQVVIAAVWAYWLCVAVMVVRSRLRFRTSAGSKPRTRRERRMWLAWVPTVISWLILPCASLHTSSAILACPLLIRQHPAFPAVEWVGASLAVLAFLLTFPCWLGMGPSWSLAVVPNKKSQLITSGMFARVRHPIYALSILLMLATVIAVPSWLMAGVALVHWTMLRMKAVSEEHYLLSLHGPQYADYCQRTGRFLPRVFLGRQGTGSSQCTISQ